MARAPARPIARQRRSSELTLIIMVGVVTVGGYTLASLGTNAEIPAHIGSFLGIVLALLLAAHLAVRMLARGADGTMLPLAALLHGVGFVMITRLDDRLSGLQATWSLVAIAAFIATLLVVQRPTDLARFKWIMFLVGSVLLVLPLAPVIGASFGDARIWVSIGPLNFQPAEFTKVTMAVFLAAYLAEKRELIAANTWSIGPLRLPEPQYIAPVLVAWGFGVLVMLGQRDLGMALMFFMLCMVMMWVATQRIVYLLGGLAMFGTAAYAAWRLFDHVQTRVDIWLDPWADPLGSGYQPVQAIYGLSDGGILGTGLGLGSPNRVPEAQHDYIFAALAEELGLVGGAAILMAFLLLIGAGLRIAMRTDNSFEQLLAVGLTAVIGIQAFIIVGGVLKVVPLTGITLPFVSYGGSSLLVNYIILALLIRLSDSGARRRGELPDDPTPAERWAARRLGRAMRRQTPEPQPSGRRAPAGSAP